MRAGEMRHRVAIQSRQDIRDAAGQPRPIWSTLATVWASYEPLSGRETIQARIAMSEATCRWRIRYYPGLTPRHRVMWGARVFDINSVADVDGRHDEMELLCTEKV